MAPPKPVLTERQYYESMLAQLDREYSSWDSHYRDLSRYILPRNGRFFTSDRNRGERKHNTIYDNTATRALRVAGAGMMAGATSPARPWMRLATRDWKLNRSQAVRQWLDDVTRLVLRAFAKSNAYRVLHQMYEELLAFGTAACIVVEDYDNVIHLLPLTVGEYRIGQDHRGRVNRLYRVFDRTVGDVVNEFGYAACSTMTQEAYDNRNLLQPVTVVHVIEERTSYDPARPDAENMPWASVYFEKGRAEAPGKPERFLRKSGFRSFPVLAPRWAVVGGDVYGHSPGMESLGDVKQLQHEQLRKAQGIDFKANPPIVVPSTMRNREVDRLPGGVSYVDSAAPQGAVRSLFEVNLDLAHLLEDIVDVRQRINSSFFADLFLMLALAGKEAKMTATEVAERHEEKLIQLGPVLERLHTELLAPLVQMTYQRLLEGGAIPPPPSEVQGLGLDIEFISMLAQAQRAVAVNTIDRGLQFAAGLASVIPEVTDRLDGDFMLEDYFDAIGVPARAVRPLAAAQEARRARAQAQTAVAQAQMLEGAGRTAKDLAGAAAAAPQGAGAAGDILSLFSGYDSPPPQAY